MWDLGLGVGVLLVFWLRFGELKPLSRALGVLRSEELKASEIKFIGNNSYKEYALMS